MALGTPDPGASSSGGRTARGECKDGSPAELLKQKKLANPHYQPQKTQCQAGYPKLE